MTEQENQKHYYRLSSDSEAGAQMQQLFARARVAVNAASALAKELNALYFEPSSGCVAGGISVFYFKRKPQSRRWETLKRMPDNLYAAIPNAETQGGRFVLSRLAQLPIVKTSELANVLGVADKLNHGEKTPLCFPIEDAYTYICSDYELNLDDAESVTEEEWLTAREYYESMDE